MNDADNESAKALLAFKNGFNDVNGKYDDDEPEEVEQLELCPSVFGLRRVDEVERIRAEKAERAPSLNRRGVPARLRKKNTLIYNDEMYNSETPTKKESHPRTPVKSHQPKSTIASPKVKPKPSHTPSKKAATFVAVKKVVPPPLPKKSTTGVVAVKKIPVVKVIHQPQPHQQRQHHASPLETKNHHQILGNKLRNLLRLDKAYNWVCSEWFYSNIDRPLFLQTNDFMICLRETFPQLKTFNLTRAQWSIIRRLMGKPRRCSQNFFAQEISELERRRNKIRLLQQRKAAEVNGFKDVPEEIPLQPVIGTKVTARLSGPIKGLFTGSVVAVDTSNNTYRISFDREGLGTHSVPDYDVLSNDGPETMSKTALLQKFRPRLAGSSTNNHQHSSSSSKLPSKGSSFSSSAYSSGNSYNETSSLVSNQQTMSSFNNSSSRNEEKINVDVYGMVGEHPLHILETMARLRKILNIKKAQIQTMGAMNTETERMQLYGQPVPQEFQARYAGNIVALESINNDLSQIVQTLNGEMKKYSESEGGGGDEQLSSQSQSTNSSEASVKTVVAKDDVSTLTPAYLQVKCQTEASQIVKKHNIMDVESQSLLVENDEMLNLIHDLTSLMLQIKNLAEYDRQAFEVDVLKQTMVAIKLKLSPNNQKVFESCIEIHMRHIQEGLIGSSKQ